MVYLENYLNSTLNNQEFGNFDTSPLKKRLIIIKRFQGKQGKITCFPIFSSMNCRYGLESGKLGAFVLFV